MSAEPYRTSYGARHLGYQLQESISINISVVVGEGVSTPYVALRRTHVFGLPVITTFEMSAKCWYCAMTSVSHGVGFQGRWAPEPDPCSLSKPVSKD